MNRILVAGSVAFAFGGALAAGLTTGLVGADAAGMKPIRFQNEKDLSVVLVTPTLNQEVLPDLSDPGVNNKVTVHFSSPVRRRDVINRQNAFNGLSSRFEFFDSSFNRLPGRPAVRRSRVTFDPRNEDNGGMLPQGQYTLNVKRNVRNRRGRLLNFGKEDFSTTFTVGVDTYPPVLRRMSPIDGQTNIGLFQRVVATFNEPIDVASIISTIQVQDASTNPPAAIPGAGFGNGVTLERRGFDVVFTPDPCFGYPPQTTIQFLMQGQNQAGTAAPVTDVFGNAFVRDPGLQWSFNAAAGVWESPNGTFDDATGVFRTQFQTKGVKPRPVGLVPGSPHYNLTPFAGPCSVATPGVFSPSCYATGRVFLYSTGNGLGEIDLTPFIARFNQGITDFSLVSVVANSPVRIGRPLGLLVDPRFDVNAGLHTFLYVVDQRTQSIAVLDSRNLQVLGRFAGFSSPRDIGIASDAGNARMSMFVSEFAANQLVVLDMKAYTVSLSGQPGAASPCEAIQDASERRAFIATGRGPTSVSADGVLRSRVATTNTLDSSLTVVNVANNSVRGTFETGTNPVDFDWISQIGFGLFVGCTANQGGLVDPDGSVSMYLNGQIGGGTPGAAQVVDGIDATLTDQIKNPTSIWGNSQRLNIFFNSSPAVWYVANTGGTDVHQLVVTSSGLFGQSIGPGITLTFEVGPNPSSAIPDPYYPYAFLFASVLGTGRFAGVDPGRPLPAQTIRVPGIRRLFTCYSH